MRTRTAIVALATVMLTVGATGALAIAADQAQSSKPAAPTAHGIHVGELYCADARQATADPEDCLYMGPALTPIVTHAVPLLYGKGVQ